MSVEGGGVGECGGGRGEGVGECRGIMQCKYVRWSGRLSQVIGEVGMLD